MHQRSDCDALFIVHRSSFSVRWFSMKLSLNSIKRLGYEDLFKLPINDLADIIGAQLGALEELPVYLGVLYDGIIVAKVMSCIDHPDANRLHVCLIDDGGVVKNVKRDKNGYVQVVCGAPNVKEGMLVAWLPPGSIVPSSVANDPFTLEAKELRGVVSNGMLASPSELAITDNHDGLLEILPEEVGKALAVPGTPFQKLYDLDDYILNIENKMFTHRPDCFGLLGIGREIAGIQGKSFKSPEWYVTEPKIPVLSGNKLDLKFKNELPKLVSRFVLIPMSNVSVHASPVLLQSTLARHGIRPINNVVDVTNYYMILTGQPLHAYDYDKVKALSGDSATIVVRHPKAGEKISLLNGKTIEPRAEAIMIATDKQLIGIGGVMGGANTEVDTDTKNIILEIANFDMFSIRRTSMTHGLFTDAVTRFNKGQSPLQNLSVAFKAVADLIELTGAKVAGTAIDDNHLSPSIIKRQSLYEPVTITAEFINDRLGLALSLSEIKTLLTNVEFKVEAKGSELIVTAPFWRTDIEIREDLVEEVGRLYGYDKLPLQLPMRDLTPATEDQLLSMKSAIRSALSKVGANEVLTYSFVDGNLLDKVGQDKTKAYQLSNAISPDLQYYRSSLIPSLLDKVHANIKAGYDEFALFELGKTHSLEQPADSEDLPSEYDITALVVAANDKLRKTGAAYYQARKFLTNLAGDKLVVSPITDEMKNFSITKPYDLNRSAMVSNEDGKFLGIIGEFKSSVSRQLKLPKYCAGFEVDTVVLGEMLAKRKSYVVLPRYPKVTQDMTLKVPASLNYQELFDFVSDELDKALPKNSLCSVTPVDIYQREDDKDHKQISLRFVISNYDRTLTDKEVNGLLDKVAEAAQTKFTATRI